MYDMWLSNQWKENGIVKKKMLSIWEKIKLDPYFIPRWQLAPD